MKEEISIFKSRVQTFQMTILVLQVFLMMIGGSVFGLGVLTRPILRITKPEFFFHVEWILDMMIATGFAQLATAGLDCFAACWKLLWPIYLGIGLTSITVCLEIGALGTSLQLLSKADSMVNEDVVHPWYWVECQAAESCHDAMLSYIYAYVLPQIVLVAVAIFLQCLGILYLGKLVRTLAEHHKMVVNYREWYREHMEQPVPKSAIRLPPEIELEEEEVKNEGEAEDDEPGKEVVDLDYNSPSSILKTDHGYVAASGASLDYDDSYMKNRSAKEKVSHTQSISFNTNVQVHYYDAKANLLTSTKKKSIIKNTSQVRLIAANEDDEMNDLTPETIQLQKSSAKNGKNNNSQQRLDLARVASNLTKILAADSPETVPGESQVVEYERTATTQPPPAPPSTPLDESVSFNFSPVPPPSINSKKNRTPKSTPTAPSPPMPSSSTSVPGSNGKTASYNLHTSFTPKSFD